MNDKELEKFLSQFKTKIKPSEELARKIVADLSPHLNFRCGDVEIREKKKGRLSGYELIFNQIHNLMIKWKILVPVALVILIAVVWGIVQFGQKAPITGPEGEKLTGGEQLTGEEQPTAEEYIEKKYVETPKEVPVPETTGDIDNVIDAMVALSENEMVIITDEGNDASLINLDSQAISDFGQSYDENEF
ncbi:MAG: hypothetical protein ACOZAL_03840 [Patescibacteria group bacterium]